MESRLRELLPAQWLMGCRPFTDSSAVPVQRVDIDLSRSSGSAYRSLVGEALGNGGRVDRS